MSVLLLSGAKSLLNLKYDLLENLVLLEISRMCTDRKVWLFWPYTYNVPFAVYGKCPSLAHAGLVRKSRLSPVF
jgi:hypothetical protein